MGEITRKDDMEKTELKPCPFCGAKTVTVKEAFNGWHVGCKKCFCTIGFAFRSKEWAKKMWNRREK